MGRQRGDADLEASLARALVAGITEGERRAFERVLLAAASEALGSDARDVEGFVREVGAERALPLITEAASEVWPERYRRVLGPVLSAVMVAKSETNAPVLGSFDLANPKIREAFDGYIGPLVKGISETSRENAYRVIESGLEDGLANADIAAALRQKLPELNTGRATLIARTETTRAANTASLIQARESGVVTKKRWLATNDDRTREEHAEMDGETVGIDETFSNGLDSPSEPNCRCSMTFVVDMDALAGERGSA